MKDDKIKKDKKQWKEGFFFFLVLSLVFVPVDWGCERKCMFDGWKFIFKLGSYDSINLSVLFLQILIVLVVFFGIYHLKFEKD